MQHVLPPQMMTSPAAGAAGAAAPMTQAPMVQQPAGMSPTVTAPPQQQQPPMGNDMMPTSMDPPPTQMPANPNEGLAMDECGLDTQWPGDEYCINPPPADKGFQIHLGPTSYDNPEREYIMEPGSETTVSIPAVSGNKQQVYFYWRQYRMRPGSHHLIVSAGVGRRLGGTQNLAKDNPERGMIAPENKGVGMPLEANTQLSNSLHYYNFTDKPIIKEVWVNFWYRDPSEVTEPANEIFSMLGMGIQPGQHVIKRGECTITTPGRILTLYGHIHSHNKRFAAWRIRGGDEMLIHDSYDWEHPGVSEYSSLTMNPPLNPAAKTAGGYSGVMDVMPGDVIAFECDIVNDTQSVFRGANEAADDEMCILIGDSVGTRISPICESMDLPATGN